VKSPSVTYYPTQYTVANFPCADPYAWYNKAKSEYQLICTFGGLGLGMSKSLENAYFNHLGDALGVDPKHPPGTWVTNDAIEHWAPEVVQVGNVSYIFFSNTVPNSSPSKHQLGWSASIKGVNTQQFTYYSEGFMYLGDTAGGEIDSTVFVDPLTQRSYFIWKSDDNNAGSTSTRIWIQEIVLSEDMDKPGYKMTSAAEVILDSTGLWWVDSWVPGGSLIEAPELVYENGYYYLFFAAGKFCEYSYSEGVARSKNLFGPYEKHPLPLLSSGLIGYSTSSLNKPLRTVAANFSDMATSVMSGTGDGLVKLLGPGHATYLRDARGDLFAIYHASTGAGGACVRYPFVNKILYTEDLWPYVSFL